MGLFDDVNRFFEDRLDEFLRNNPHLELQALEEQLREQEQDAQRLITQLQLEEKRLQEEIVNLASEIKLWHARIEKAKAAGRLDLVKAVQEREASLLRQGNQLWGQMEGAKKRLLQAKELLVQFQQKRQQVQAKAATVKAAQANAQAKSSSQSSGWNQAYNYSNAKSSLDPLEQQFQDLETNEELEKMKRELGK